MVPRAGLEPAQPYSRGILNPLCLPISPPGLNLEARPGVEPRWADLQSAAWPLCQRAFLGAGNETRTRDPDLGKVVLYQLSYSRLSEPLDLLNLFRKSHVPFDALHSTYFTK